METHRLASLRTSQVSLINLKYPAEDFDSDPAGDSLYSSAEMSGDPYGNTGLKKRDRANPLYRRRTLFCKDARPCVSVNIGVEMHGDARLCVSVNIGVEMHGDAPPRVSTNIP